VQVGRSYRGYSLERRFALLHPVAMMLFFAGTIVISLISYHPVILGLSFALAAISVAYYAGIKALIQSLSWLGPMLIIVILFNTVFNRRGATELFTIERFQMTFTQESLLFGISVALMMAAIILWFRLYQEFMTSDRFLYLFAPIAPTLALSITMIQRWIPLTKYRWQQIRNADKMLSDCSSSYPASAQSDTVHDAATQKSKGRHNRVTRFAPYKSLTHSLSALMSWSMEDAIQAADSMQARGYQANTGNRDSVRALNSDSDGEQRAGTVHKSPSKKAFRRTSFRYFRFISHDAVALALIATLALLAGLAIFFSTRGLAFFPIYRGAEDLSITAALAASLLMSFPLLLEGKEQLRWRLSAQTK